MHMRDDGMRLTGESEGDFSLPQNGRGDTQAASQEKTGGKNVQFFQERDPSFCFLLSLSSRRQM